MQGKFPAYSSNSENGGIVGYYDTPEFICDERKPSYVIFGDHTRTMSIARTSFSVLDNVKVLHPTIDNDNALLFIFSVWKKQIPNLGYKRHWGIAKECVLQLPTQDMALDIAFMDSFITELKAECIVKMEAERISKLSAYLTASGLNNYELSKEEEKSLEAFLQNNYTFEGFRFDAIFNNIKQGSRLKKEDQLPGNTPFVMSGTTNTGVVGHISNPVAVFPANSITIDIFGNSFYRKYAFGAGDDTGVYWNDKTAYSEKTMLYFAAAMEKALQGKYSFGKKLRSSQSNAFNMMLPAKNGKPDYQAMDLLISAIIKLVIKDVALYTSRNIATTKAVARKTGNGQWPDAIEAASETGAFDDNLIYLPIVGEVAAGHEHFADDEILGELGVDPAKLHPKTPGKHFILRVTGDSMIGAGIEDGDHVLIRRMSNPKADIHNGDVVVCQVHGDRATLKTFYQEADHIRLHPENEAYQDISVPFEEFEMNEARIIGRCISILNG